MTLKRAVSFMLAIAIVFSSAYAGFSQADFDGLFTIGVKATSVSENGLEFTLNEDGKSYSVAACENTVSGEIVIPSEYSNLPVTNIAAKAFAGCHNLTSVIIPEGIISIEDQAFSYCRSVTGITLPHSLKTLGNAVFESCYNLFYVNLGNGVDLIPDQTFSYCRNLKKVLFTGNVKEVGENAFFKCVSLQKIYYKSTVDLWQNISIGDGNDCINNAQIITDYNYDKIYDNVYTTDDKVAVSYSGHSNVSFVSSDSKVLQVDGVTSSVNTTGTTNTKVVELDMVNEANVKFTYGEYYMYTGKYVTGQQGMAGSEFIAVENYDANIAGRYITCCVWDKDKNFIRGYCDISKNIELDPSKGDAYVTITATVKEENITKDGIIDGGSPSRFVLTRNVEVAQTSKTFEIFGDSISTFDGYIVDGNVPFYSTESESPSGYISDVTDVSRTWWKKLEADTGMTLVRNDSHAGRCISYTYYGGLVSPENSFVSAVEKRFSETTMENPDVFVIYGGVNDACAATSTGGVGYGNNLGAVKYSGWTSQDMELVAPSLCYIFDLIQKEAPESEIIFVIDQFINVGHCEYGALIKSVCEYYGVEVCGMGYNEIIGDAHPNSAGMTQIKNKILSVLCKDSCCFEFCSQKAISEETKEPEITVLNTGEAELKVVDVYGNTVDIISLLIVEGEHQFVFDSIELNPTCTVNGVSVYKCKFCGSKEKQTIASKGHTPSEWVIDKTATCVMDGLKHKECTICGEALESEELQSSGHASSEWIVDKNATCTSSGSKHTECTSCKTVLEVIAIASTGHISTDWITDKNATCTANGLKHKECTVCGEALESEELQSSGHKSSEWIVDSQATCTKSGSKHTECVSCKTVLEVVAIAPTGHISTDWIINKNATCTANGLKHKECTACGEALESEELQSSGHKTSEWIVDKNATCTKSGSKHTECTSCKTVLEVVAIAPTGHISTDWITDKNATCTANGLKHKECTACGEALESEELQSSGHKSSEWIVDKNATCTSSGSRHKECLECGCVLEETVILPTGHVSSDWVIHKKQACTTDGLKHKECIICGETLESESISKTGHSISQWIVDKNATCTYSGSKHTECTVCGATLETVSISATGHMPSELFVDSEPTCTGSGSKHTECTVCKEVLEVIAISPNGHTSTDWIIDKNAICTTDGLKHKECIICGETLESESISKTGHTISQWIVDKNATCTSTGSRHTECTVCGAVVETSTIEPVGHTTSDWIVVEKAACTTSGSKQKVCMVCNAVVESGVIAPKGHTPGSWEDDYKTLTKNQFCSSCGEVVKTQKIPLKTPVLKTIANTTSGVKVTWDQVAGATSYNVYRKLTGDTKWKRIATTNTSYYTDRAPKTGVTYCYTVIAKAGAVSSRYDATGISVKYVAAPTLLKVQNVNKGVQVTWSKVDGADGYYVYRKAPGETKWQKYGIIKGNSNLTYKDPSASSGITYAYAVKAYSGASESDYSANILKICYLATPALTKVTSTTSGVKFTWNKVAGAKGYYVYRRDASGKWTKIATVKSGASYLDKSARKGVTYRYTVKAFNGSYVSYFNTSGLKVTDKY